MSEADNHYDLQSAIQGATQARVYTLLGQTMVEKITAQVTSELLANDVRVLTKQVEDLRAQLKPAVTEETPPEDVETFLRRKSDAAVPQPRVRPPANGEIPSS